jgi:hypothetical protein
MVALIISYALILKKKMLNHWIRQTGQLKEWGKKTQHIRACSNADIGSYKMRSPHTLFVLQLAYLGHVQCRNV